MTDMVDITAMKGMAGMHKEPEPPVLWSFRRCPYAMRARLALQVAGIDVWLREVLLRDKPTAFLQTSEKGTVPVLVLADGRVVEESRDIMIWALSQNDPQGWLRAIINLAYNVHGNEPSSSEAAMLAAYTLVASEDPQIQSFRENAIIFIDPTINPDGRDRHTQWANTYKGSPLVSDPLDAEHNEAWAPRENQPLLV